MQTSSVIALSKLVFLLLFLVLVGCNEGMSQTVRELGVGIVATDDGSADEIIKSFEELQIDYKAIKQACTSKKRILSWESQEEILIDAVIG